MQFSFDAQSVDIKETQIHQKGVSGDIQGFNIKQSLKELFPLKTKIKTKTKCRVKRSRGAVV